MNEVDLNGDSTYYETYCEYISFDIYYIFKHTYLLTKSMEQSPPSEANRLSTS